jgi:hypothetical protein
MRVGAVVRSEGRETVVNILPCPSGHPASISTWETRAPNAIAFRRVPCIRCLTCGWRGPIAPTVEEAIALWNERTHQTRHDNGAETGDES